MFFFKYYWQSNSHKMSIHKGTVRTQFPTNIIFAPDLPKFWEITHFQQTTTHNLFIKSTVEKSEQAPKLSPSSMYQLN